ncbi:MAG: BrnA antitoxin family protein [Clostridia bacterium]|nr:BrnA antitoxin family protein [Clostridia bacterium]MBR6512009.1 BrnA antitoxin family protein [Clostridia bacterium]
MRDEYEIEKLNPRKNPYAEHVKKQITINIDSDIIAYFKALADETGVPYQTLINLYLKQCVREGKRLSFK